jgi:hypothetical protein
MAPAKPPTRTEQIQHDHRERRQARYQEIIALHLQGTSVARLIRPVVLA